MTGRAAPAHVLRAGAVAATVLALAAGLVGCGRGVDDRLAQVRTQIERQERDAALVSVKALLQQQPDLGPARLLLGQLLLERGEPATAEIELRRALELQQPEAAVLPLLARALLAGNKAALLVSQFGRSTLADPLAMAQLKTTVAEAEAAQDQLDAARDSLAQALRAVPGHAPARLLGARVDAVSGDLPAALAAVKAVLADQPQNADAWVMQGDLLARQTGPAAAPPEQLAQAYRQALAVQPAHAGAHAALIGLLLAQGDDAAARTQHGLMRQQLPKHPQTLLYEGQLVMRQGDLARAREVFQLLRRGAPDNLLLLQLAGQVELRLGAPAQAEVLLSRAVQLAPASAPARRLAARAQLALGQPARALTVLEPLTGAQTADAEALSLAAQARLMAGEADAAAALFQRAARIRPDDPRIRTAVALSNLQRGQGDTALAELQRVAADDAQGTSADMALIAVQMQRRAYGPALQAIAALDKKLPDQPLPAHLRGQVLVLQRDLPGARAAFTQALAKAPAYLPAVSALAALDLADGQSDAARARFQALLQAQPRLAAAHLALAELDQRSGAGRDAVAARLEAGIQASPDDATLRMALVSHHLATANAKAAVAAAQAGLAKLPDDPGLLGLLGRGQLAAGDSQQALTSFNRLVGLQGRSPAAHLGLADAQLAAGDLTGARRSLQRVLEIDPDHLAAQRQGVVVAMRQQQPEQALALARQLQKRQPALADGWLLEGEVHIARQQWDPAVAALRQASAKADPLQSAVRLHQALQRAGRAADAQAMASAWLQAHPRDMLFLFHLGDEALRRQDWPAAEARYRQVLGINPAHALSLNNVAWLLLQQKQPGALALARRAVQVAPDQAALRDTLAQALAEVGQLPEAVGMQKQALALQPDDPNLRLRLARLYAQVNEKKLAKAELDRLAALGDRYPRQAEVAEVLKSLGGRL